MNRPMTIYIAGPYTADSDEKIWRNVTAAIDAGIQVYRRGHYPYIPHLTHFVENRSKEIGADLQWEDYLKWDHAWLKLCDAFLYLASSRGADLELGWAKKHRLRIFYRLQDIPELPHSYSDSELMDEILGSAKSRPPNSGQ